MNIWLAALGYFLAYAPYSALTKAMSSGALPGVAERISGVAILPVSTMASLIGMVLFLWGTGWWRSAAQFQFAGRSWPRATRSTVLSGLCTAVILMTTTLAYTFEGVSIVFVMLLMRGGVLVMAPLIDELSGRAVRWYSWGALLLSIGALLVAFAERTGYDITATCGINVGLYLLAYFIRLQFMSRLAKSSERGDSHRFFAEEQLVATPAALVLLALMALLGPESLRHEIVDGFTGLGAGAALAWGAVIGVLSQGTGIFGGLILLDGRENTFCVPVNRASSILAGVVAAYLLVLFMGKAPPGATELIGAGLVVAAILLLTLGPKFRPAARPPA